MLKTIKEVAEQVGVSKTAIYSLIKTHKIPVIKENRLTYMDRHGVSMVMAHYSITQDETIEDIIQDSLNIDSNIDSMVDNTQLVKILENQLSEKQEVIRGLLETVNTLSKVVENEQRLKAMPLLVDVSDKQASADGQPHKKSFWDRFLKR